jgi:hypothetical protein
MRHRMNRVMLATVLATAPGALSACARSPRAAVDSAGAPVPATQGASNGMSSAQPGTLNTLTAKEQRDGWKLLFDGKTLNGWQEYGGKPISEGWTVEDGTLVLRGRSARDIVTARPYGRYELALEWRLEPTGPAGNSGIFYDVIDTASAIYWGAPEMAVLDNARHPDGKAELTSSGAVHSMYAVPHSATRPTGEWNSVRLVVNGDHIEHWLNGVKVVEYELGSADWKARLAKSKFADKPLYGTARSGRIGLQQHGSYVAYRNIKIRELK